MPRAAFNLIAAVVCVVLAAQIYALQSRPIAVEAARAAAPEAPAPVEAREVRFEAPPARAFAAIAARPLFDPDRRPKAPEAPMPAAPIQPPSIRVTGLVSAGGRAKAIIATADSASDVVAIGDEVEGWTVAEIADGVLVLERDGARHEARLDAVAEAAAPQRDARPREETGGARAGGPFVAPRRGEASPGDRRARREAIRQQQQSDEYD